MPRAITTNGQANSLSKLYSDLDNYRRYYSLREDTEEELLVQFVSPQLAAYEEYRFTLLKNSVTKQLEPKYYYRPDYVSFDEYGTTNLWSLLLFVNNIPTIEDFDVENIMIPDKFTITNISRDIVNRSLITEIVPLNEIPQKEKARLYYQKKIVPRPIIPSISAPVYTPSDLYYNKELFTVTNIIALQRYVDLKFEPVIESLQMNVQDHPNYLVNKHYKIIKGSSGYNRLTWDPKKLSGGIGLVNTMIEGTIFEVQYARKVVS